jgi:hypothetical protein
VVFQTANRCRSFISRARLENLDIVLKGDLTHLRNKIPVVLPTWKSATMSPNSLPCLMHSSRGFLRYHRGRFHQRGVPALWAAYLTLIHDDITSRTRGDDRWVFRGRFLGLSGRASPCTRIHTGAARCVRAHCDRDKNRQPRSLYMIHSAH